MARSPSLSMTPARGEAGAFDPRRSGRAPFGSASDLRSPRSRGAVGGRSRRRDRRDGARQAAGVALHGSARRRALAKGLSCCGRDLVAGDGERAVGVGASSLSPRKLPPAARASVRPRMVMCWGRWSRRAPWAVQLQERAMGRGRSSGHRGRGRAKRRFVARVGGRRRAPVDRWSAACVSQSRRSAGRARSRRSLDFSGGVSLGRPDASVCPLGFVRP
jgi:hypothetical protein